MDIQNIPIAGGSQGNPQILADVASMKRSHEMAIVSHYNIRRVIDTLVDAGVGASIVPESAARRIVSTVAVCSITDQLPESEIGLAFARHNTAAVVRRFSECACRSLNH
jgi:DNA-binding transcriptional LysR family regulator